MNLICAYCGVPFVDRRSSRGYLFSGQHKWAIFVAALLFPVVGLVAGGLCVGSASTIKRSAGRLWLIAGLCSSIAYVVAWRM
jgi:hypothetical protein